MHWVHLSTNLCASRNKSCCSVPSNNLAPLLSHLCHLKNVRLWTTLSLTLTWGNFRMMNCLDYMLDALTLQTLFNQLPEFCVGQCAVKHYHYHQHDAKFQSNFRNNAQCSGGEGVSQYKLPGLTQRRGPRVWLCCYSLSFLVVALFVSLSDLV
jgi:hypothetical protein